MIQKGEYVIDNPMSISPNEEATVPAAEQMQLNGQQNALYLMLDKKDTELSKMYLGALYVLNQKQNPDRLSLAAHGIRELLEKLPKIVGITPQKPDLVDRCKKLANKWERDALQSECLIEGTFNGKIDRKMQLFLVQAAIFFKWFSGRPSRRDERTKMMRALDSIPINLPKPIEKIRTDELAEYVGYFNGVSHHTNAASDIEFSKYLYHVERFLLDFLQPRTFEDLSNLDAIIKAGEEDG